MFKQLRPAVVSVLLFALFAGFGFPFAITGAAHVLFRWQADGSLIRRNGVVVGSHLIGQGFVGPKYFHPRPSAAGAGYDATASGGTNLGPTSRKLVDGIHQRLPNGTDNPSNFDGVRDLAKTYRSENDLAPGTLLPADAVTRSASGLDPDISPENAALQSPRVARRRGMSLTTVRKLVASNTRQRTLGLLGEPRVNVLELNLAIDAAQHSASNRG